MTLVDTSVWIDFLRAGDAKLADRLTASEVVTHPFVIGELACGNLDNREEILGLLGKLHRVPLASHDEVLLFIDAHQLAGSGLGVVDAHLLASARLSGYARILTRDRALESAARRLDISAT